jgi:hypothetical protein
MKNFIGAIKRFLHKVIAYIVAIILHPGAIYSFENFRLWEKRGYHITPLHFYYPIPDTRELEIKDLPISELPGINMRPEFQLKLMKETFSRFSEDYKKFLVEPTNSNHFYLDNDAFTGIDPFIYYCMIRHFQPSTIIEVGSGHSTLLGAQACHITPSTRYISIDPWPREFISKGVPGVELLCQRVEDLDVEFFQQLKPNDILFIDSSHTIRTSGDVSFLVLEVIPRLASGVVIHFHDIFLPYDYPKEWLIEQQRFWTEQYLLQAYLSENDHVEVLFASQFVTTKYPREVWQAFPNALSIGGASFWMRKC